MNETTIRVLSVEDFVSMAAPLAGGVQASPGELEVVMVPTRTRVAVDGLPWAVEATLTFNDQVRRFDVAELTVRARDSEDGRIPDRGLRELRLGGLAVDVLIATGRRWSAADDDDADGPAAEPVVAESGGVAFGRPMTMGTARVLSRGRSKSAGSVQHMRAEVVATYRQIGANGEHYPDVYAEIARRLNIGRTTVWRHLRDTGEIGGRR